MANDNDFVPGIAGDNKFFVFKFTDADLNGSQFVNQALSVSAVPEPANVSMLISGLFLMGWLQRRRQR